MSRQTFTFLLYDNTQATPYFALDMLENEAAARPRALDLLEESKRFVAVEVSDDRGSTFTIERPPAPPPHSPFPRRTHRVLAARRRPPHRGT